MTQEIHAVKLPSSNILLLLLLSEGIISWIVCVYIHWLKQGLNSEARIAYLSAIIINPMLARVLYYHSVSVASIYETSMVFRERHCL